MSQKPSVLITGASTGIGATYAQRFAARGHDLVLVARDASRMEALATQLRADFGVDVDIIKADLTKPDDLAKVEARLRDDHRIGILINNAGAASAGSFIEQSSDQITQMATLNSLSLLRLAHAVAPRLVKAGDGAIVNIGSVVGLAPEFGQSVYAATKAFVLMLSQGLNLELAPHGVYVQAVLPAATKTEIWERAGADLSTLPPMMEVTDLVDAALVGFDRREGVTIPPLADEAAWQTYDTARLGVLGKLNQDTVGDRYKAAISSASKQTRVPDMTQDILFIPYTLGTTALANRIVMAPLTRNRAAAGLVPGPHAAEYYAQRATAGLIITEATQISPQAQGYQDTPGIYSDAQIAGWRSVTDAVHAAGGKIFMQIWHVGRISHVDVQPGGAAPVAPSAIRADTKVFVKNGFHETSEPRALELDEIPGIIADFRTAAANAITAGFDGVEIHGANGYLLDQFAKDGANHRTDAYGGSVENRARLMLEVAAAVVAEIGAGRTGIRIGPVSPANAITTSDPQPQFDYIVRGLDKLNLAYLHVIEGATGGPRDVAPFDYDALRAAFRNTYIANNGYDLALATERLAAGKADLIAFGKGFISNPDLVARLKTGAPLAAINPATMYGGGAEGYTDYPALG